MARELILIPGLVHPRRCRLFVLKAGERLWNTTECEPLRLVIERARSIVDNPDVTFELGELDSPLREAWMQALSYDNWPVVQTIQIMGVFFHHPESAPFTLISPSSFATDTVAPPLLTQEELLKSCRLMREFIGFHGGPPPFDPSLFTTDVVSIARQIDTSQDFALMPVLGDALEETGCFYRKTFIEHCRSKEAHERGCWLIDGLLGRP